jgi:cell division protein YceG involved in septum cleavage
MRRTYNNKISARANHNLARRARTVSVQKRMITLISIVIISCLILIGSSIRAFASSHVVEDLHKYYTSIEVQKGDTLWNIADNYIMDGVMSRDDFIDTVCTINGISENDILKSGDHIVVVYYSSEVK